MSWAGEREELDLIVIALLNQSKSAQTQEELASSLSRVDIEESEFDALKEDYVDHWQRARSVVSQQFGNNTYRINANATVFQNLYISGQLLIEKLKRMNTFRQDQAIRTIQGCITITSGVSLWPFQLYLNWLVYRPLDSILIRESSGAIEALLINFLKYGLIFTGNQFLLAISNTPRVRVVVDISGEVVEELVDDSKNCTSALSKLVD